MTLHDLVMQLFPYAYDKGGGEVSVNCPFCIEEVGKIDTKQRLGINTDTGVAHCYRCEWKGGKRKIFRELCRVFQRNEHLDIEEDEYAEKPKYERKEKPKKQVATSLPEEYEPLWRNVNDKIGRRALAYVLSRNITEEQIKNHRIGFCATGDYAHRIIFPVYRGRRIRGIVARDFSGKSDIKYKNSAGGKTIYNYPRKRQLVCHLLEGITDVLSMERAMPHQDAVATLGRTLTKFQLKLLARYKKIVIWPDPDRPGVDGAIKKAIQLQKKKVIVYMVVPETEEIENEIDVGRMLPVEIESKYRQRRPFTLAVAKLMRARIAFAAPPKKKARIWPGK